MVVAVGDSMDNETKALLAAILLILLVLSPLVPVVIVSIRKRWPFRRTGIYVVVYLQFLGIVIYGLAGVRGWELIVGMVGLLAISLFGYFAYVHLIDIYLPRAGKGRR
jgi:hypothetical protein